MRLTERVHQILEKELQSGDLAIDATAGNGHDCLKIAQLLAPNGRLIAIDRQLQAIRTSRNRLEQHRLEHLCTFMENDHAKALLSLCQKDTAQAKAIVFNLGYLPGGDKSIRSTSHTTLAALDAAKRLLQPEGLLLVTAYRGHDGGIEEAEAVALWMNQFSGAVVCYEPNRTGERIPPILWVAKSKGHDPHVPDATQNNHPPLAGR
ncbi:MAG: class I SAM-dependent methyltransferase [Coraliomargaritaceae bacterium]